MLERPSLSPTTFRPVGRIRVLAGRHRTLWRVISGACALVLALTFAPDAAPVRPPDSTLEELNTESPTPNRPVDGRVGVALPRSTSFPALTPGDIVHAIAVNDPLISGEVRQTAIVVRNARVLDTNDSAVTIEATETDAVLIVEAVKNGSVALVTTVG